jgi:hypothetical protein
MSYRNSWSTLHNLSDGKMVKRSRSAVTNRISWWETAQTVHHLSMLSKDPLILFVFFASLVCFCSLSVFTHHQVLSTVWKVIMFRCADNDSAWDKYLLMAAGQRSLRTLSPSESSSCTFRWWSLFTWITATAHLVVKGFFREKFLLTVLAFITCSDRLLPSKIAFMLVKGELSYYREIVSMVLDCVHRYTTTIYIHQDQD